MKVDSETVMVLCLSVYFASANEHPITEVYTSGGRIAYTISMPDPGSESFTTSEIRSKEKPCEFAQNLANRDENFRAFSNRFGIAL